MEMSKLIYSYGSATTDDTGSGILSKEGKRGKIKYKEVDAVIE